MHRWCAAFLVLAMPAILSSAPPGAPSTIAAAPALLDPGPISLELHDATFVETLAALSHATGARIRSSGFPELEPSRYTLSAKNQPFWEVFTTLSRQGHWDIQGMGNDVDVALPGAGLTDYQVVGPFLIYVDSVVEASGRDYRFPGDRGKEGPGTVINLRVIADPRLGITGAKPILVTELLDAKEHNLIQPRKGLAEAGAPYAIPTFADVSRHVFFGSCSVPPTTDKKITLLRGKAEFRLGARAVVVPFELKDVPLP